MTDWPEVFLKTLKEYDRVRPNVVGNVEANKEGKHLVDNRQIIFDDMNHLQSFLLDHENKIRTDWPEVFLKILKEYDRVRANVVGNIEAKKEGKHLVDNRQIIFDECMNHLELFLLDHENEIRAKILSNVVNHLESKSKQLQLSGKIRKGLQRKDASLERKRHYFPREHKSNTQTQIIKPCALCNKMVKIYTGKWTDNKKQHAICHIPGYWECEYCITKSKRKADLVKHLSHVHNDFISEPSLSITMNEYNDVLEKKAIECFPDK